MSEFALDHAMMRVGDLDASIDWYADHLDYVEHARWEADTFTNVYLGPADQADEGAYLELTSNHDQDEVDVGDAFGHVAVRTRDVHDAYDELMDAGVPDYRDPDSCGGHYAFVRDPDGHEIELVERDHGAPWSLDHVMIRVEDADRALGYWTRKFEYADLGRWEADTFANYFMAPADAGEEAMKLELTYNYDGRTYEFGEAWGHLAVRTDDLHEGWDALVTREAPDYRDPASCDDNYAFTTTPDGHEVEVLDPENSPMHRD